MLRHAAVSLKCTTDANPDAHIYHFYLNDNPIGNSSSGVLNTTVMEDGIYTCVPINTVGTGDNATVSITAVGKCNRSFIHVFSRRATGFHRQAKLFYLKFFITKTSTTL